METRVFNKILKELQIKMKEKVTYLLSLKSVLNKRI